MARQVKDIICDKEDCGSLLFNIDGWVVGMIVGTIQATHISTEGRRSYYMSALYVDIDDILRWCPRVTGEQVKIICGTPELA
jgi:hypothetical protein